MDEHGWRAKSVRAVHTQWLLSTNRLFSLRGSGPGPKSPPAHQPPISWMKQEISTCGEVVHNPEIVVPMGLSALHSWVMNTLTRTLITTFPLLCAAGVAAAPAAAHPEIGAPPAVRPSAAPGAPAVPHHGGPSPICAGGGTVVLAQPPERVGQPNRPTQRAAAPGKVPAPPSLSAAPGADGLPPRSPDRSSDTAGSCGGAPIVVPVTVPRRELVPGPVPVQVTIHDLGAAPARPQGTDQSPGSRSEIEIVVRSGGGSGSAAELPAVLREMLRSLAAQQRVPTPRPHR